MTLLADQLSRLSEHARVASPSSKDPTELVDLAIAFYKVIKAREDRFADALLLGTASEQDFHQPEQLMLYYDQWLSFATLVEKSVSEARETIEGLDEFLRIKRRLASTRPTAERLAKARDEMNRGGGRPLDELRHELLAQD